MDPRTIKSETLLGLYDDILVEADYLMQEVELSRSKWEKILITENHPCALSCLQDCDSTFSQYSFLFAVVATLPVATGTRVRSLSTLRRLKTPLVSSTRQEMLGSLTFLAVYINIYICLGKVKDVFAGMKNIV